MSALYYLNQCLYGACLLVIPAFLLKVAHDSIRMKNHLKVRAAIAAVLIGLFAATVYFSKNILWL